MNVREYADQARTTAIYPEEYRVIYPTLGLAGEVGEVSELVKKWIRDEDKEPMMEPSRRLELEKELGDVLWYWANLCIDLGLKPEIVAQYNLEKLASRKERGVLKGSGSDR